MRIRKYNYEMGFKINNVPIPDPSTFSGAISDLDTEGGRSATGDLHRNLVATKHPLKLAYNALDWGTIQEIITPMAHQQEFSFTFPCPESAGRQETIRAYAGDREWDLKHVMTDGDWTYVGSLSFSILEF